MIDVSCIETNGTLMIFCQVFMKAYRLDVLGVGLHNHI